jgi:hypothetical protein
MSPTHITPKDRERKRELAALHKSLATAERLLKRAASDKTTALAKQRAVLERLDERAQKAAGPERTKLRRLLRRGTALFTEMQRLVAVQEETYKQTIEVLKHDIATLERIGP